MRIEKEITTPETKKEIQLMAEIDELFSRFEKGEDVENELRSKIKEYRRIFGKEVQEEVNEYYKKLEAIKKAA